MGKFVIRQTATGFNFLLKADNGETIGISEVYVALPSCKKGVASVRKNAPVAGVRDLTEESAAIKHPRFEIFTDRKGEFRFRLKAKNGEVILASEGYAQKASCLKGIESVRRNAVGGEVILQEK